MKLKPDKKTKKFVKEVESFSPLTIALCNAYLIVEDRKKEIVKMMNSTFDIATRDLCETVRLQAILHGLDQAEKYILDRYYNEEFKIVDSLDKDNSDADFMRKTDVYEKSGLMYDGRVQPNY